MKMFGLIPAAGSQNESGLHLGRMGECGFIQHIFELSRKTAASMWVVNQFPNLSGCGKEHTFKLSNSSIDLAFYGKSPVGFPVGFMIFSVSVIDRWSSTIELHPHGVAGFYLIRPAFNSPAAN